MTDSKIGGDLLEDNSPLGLLFKHGFLPWSSHIKHEKVYDEIIGNIYNEMKSAKTEGMYDKLS